MKTRIIFIVLTMILIGVQAFAWSGNTADIAEYAETHYTTGQYGGQCAVFVKTVLQAVTGIAPGSGWTSQPGYETQLKSFYNAQQVSMSDVTRGDIITMNWPHIAIVSSYANGNLYVTESNNYGDETIYVNVRRNTYLKSSANPRFWRVGTANTEPSPYRPESYHATAQVKKDLLALRDGSLFELAWSMECGNDLIRLAGIYSDNDWGWQFSYDATDDGAGGNEAFETYRLATTFDAEYMYVELTTNYPIQGVMSEYELGLLSPGDLYINVGGSLLENTGTLFGLALTSHSGDMTGDADPYDDIYTWDAVQQGHLYADVTFATGIFEEYAGANDWFEDGGDDPFGRANNIPTLIAQWGQDLGYQGDVSWDKPVPEPSTLFLLGSGLIGVLSLVRKKFKK